MAFYLERVPGALAFVGAGNRTKVNYPHHHPKFNIDESALFVGAELYIRYALDYLKKH